jgi:hypothetical protein
VDRRAEAVALAEELLADIEFSRLGAVNLLRKSNRLARLIDDDESLTWIGWELVGYPSDGSAVAQLAAAGRKASDEDAGSYYLVPLSTIVAQADGLADTMKALQAPSGAENLGMLLEHQRHVSRVSNAMSQLRAIEQAVVTKLSGFVIVAYHELVFSELQADLFRATQADIDGRLAPLAGDALDKIEAVSERLRTGRPEAISHAMSTCRRLIVAAADALYPPLDEPYMLGEQPLKVGNENVLNRLQAYVADRIPPGGQRDRLRRTLADLWNRVSAGTHADVDAVQARFVFLGTYIALGEVLALPDPLSD